MTEAHAVVEGISVRFVTHPHSVRTARQLVSDTVRQWGRPELVDDAGLVVTELSTNATLHSGAPFFHVHVSATGPRVRIAVGDDGAVPAAAVVRRQGGLHAGPAPGPRAEATTGRGLAIVDELAVAWGVTVEDGRKWVWAQLSGAGAPEAGAPQDAAASASAELAAPSGPLPPGWYAVQLADCPVQLGLAQDEHLDDLVRELQLVAPHTAHPELASVIRGLLDGQAAARHMGRRTSLDAAAAGLEHVTVELLLPERAAEEVQRLDDAVAAADALCRSEELLTLASSPEVQLLRRWMREQIASQILDGSPPCAYADWLRATGARN